MNCTSVQVQFPPPAPKLKPRESVFCGGLRHRPIRVSRESGPNPAKPLILPWGVLPVRRPIFLMQASLIVCAIALAGCTGLVSQSGGTKPVAPTIAAQPASQIVAVGQAATFSVAATGTAPLNYQWQKNSANISGATAASYTTPATTSADNAATFDVIVSNSAGSKTSTTATLTVNTTP